VKWTIKRTGYILEYVKSKEDTRRKLVHIVSDWYLQECREQRGVRQW
jgi:hypothetical protein